MDVIKAAQEISDAGAKLNSLAKQIGYESVESETKKDLFAYLQRITLYCQQLNITSRVSYCKSSKSSITSFDFNLSERSLSFRCSFFCKILGTFFIQRIQLLLTVI